MLIFYLSSLSEGTMLVFLRSIVVTADTEDLSTYMAPQVKVFGSFATGLYLPTSDVDVSFLVYFETIASMRKISSAYFE